MNIEWIEMGVQGCQAARLPKFLDPRGSFQKLFHADAFASVLPGFVPREIYHTVSEAYVLRGMHFQLPPHDHDKVVVCLAGAVLDVVLDLRRGDRFGEFGKERLTPDGTNCIAVPKGVAHGFLSEAPGSSLLYIVGTVHNSEADAGVRWDSFGFDWGCTKPILSDRDKMHPTLTDFRTPNEW